MTTIVPTPDLVTVTTALIGPDGHRWTIQGGRVAENGVADTTTANVIAITLLEGNLWQCAYDTSGTWPTSPRWWYKPVNPTGPEWGPQGGQAFSPIPALPSQVTQVTAS